MDELRMVMVTVTRDDLKGGPAKPEYNILTESVEKPCGKVLFEILGRILKERSEDHKPT
jgi:hypothetical protein